MRNKLASFDNDIDFRPLWRIGYVISAALMLVSVGAMLTRGLNLGIDFEGGTSWDVPTADMSVADTRDALTGTSAEGAKIQILGGDTVRVQAEPDGDDDRDAVTAALAEAAGIDETTIGVSTVGPTWGDEISAKAMRALVVFFVVIAIYMAWRLEWRMAIGALSAVVHDIIGTVGFYSLFQLEITPATVIAILTILGYSLYDTIVVFDKLQENAGRAKLNQKMTYTEITSLSMNQVLMRTLNTSITSLLPVLSMLFIGSFVLGAVTLEEFAVALAVGLVLGAYSSIFIATPLVAFLKEREPYYRNLRERLGHQEQRRATATVGASSGPAPSSAPSDPSAAAPELSGRVIPPRPRKKGKRR